MERDKFAEGIIVGFLSIRVGFWKLEHCDLVDTPNAKNMFSFE